MELKIEKARGYTEAFIDGDCGYAKFFRAAALLQSDFQFLFTDKVEDLDTVYWNFEYQDNLLILHYNVFMGLSLFPSRYGQATLSENEKVETFGALLFQRLLDQDWHPFDTGMTIGKKGWEEGTIIADRENVHGARITLEQVSDPEPGFAITFGIYGLLFHTHFKKQQEQAEQTLTWLKTRINKVFEMYELPEDQRDEFWYTKHDRLVHELTID
jgi:hypothetical protein